MTEIAGELLAENGDLTENSQNHADQNQKTLNEEDVTNSNNLDSNTPQNMDKNTQETDHLKTQTDANNNFACASMSSVSSEVQLAEITLRENENEAEENVQKAETEAECAGIEPQTVGLMENTDPPIESMDDQSETGSPKSNLDIPAEGEKIAIAVDNESVEKNYDQKSETPKLAQRLEKRVDPKIIQNLRASFEEAKASFPDSIYEPFARKLSKSKVPAVINYNHAGYEPVPRSASASFAHKHNNNNETLFRSLSRENSQPINNQLTRVHKSSFGVEEISSRHVSRKVSIARSENSIPNQNKPPENFISPEKESKPNINDYKTESKFSHSFDSTLRSIKLPKSHLESSTSATLSNHFFDGSNVSPQEYQNNFTIKTTLPSLKSSSGANKKSRSSASFDQSYGVILPNIITSQHRTNTKDSLNNARKLLRGEITSETPNESNLNPKGDVQETKNEQFSANNDLGQKNLARREVNTIRGPHPKWLMNNSHQKMGKTPIISECLPIEDRMKNKQKFMARTKQFQNPMSSRLNLVPGLAERDNASFHEIRLKLDKIENKIGNIIRNSTHVSRSFDRPNSDSLVEAPKQVLVPENPSLAFLHQESILMSNQRAYFQTKDFSNNRTDQKMEDRKLRVVNLVLDENDNYPTNFSSSFTDTEYPPIFDDKFEKSHIQLNPVLPARKPVFGRSFQEFGTSHGMISSSQKLNPRNEITRSLKTTTAHTFPKPLMKEKPRIPRSVSMKNATYEKKVKKNIPVNVQHQEEIFERISENSSEGKRTIDEMVMLKSGGEIAPW